MFIEFVHVYLYISEISLYLIDFLLAHFCFPIMVIVDSWNDLGSVTSFDVSGL